MFRNISCVWILLCVSVGLIVAVPAQAAGSVRGVLKDQKGAVLQGGTVEVRGVETDLVRSTSTDGAGRYTFDALPDGLYKISASFPGFETAVRSDVRIGEGQEMVVDIALKLAPKETVVVVTAPAMDRPLVIDTDPRAPRQPLPAHDGADYLKTIPGFSVIRKGGTDGDPVLRGMAGSRLNILMDGQQILGGCGGRMDPPTAYIFPAAYKHITVFKGPQTVLYGPMSAGTVLFERNMSRAESAGIQVQSSVTVGSFGRHDEMVDADAAFRFGYVQAVTTRSHSDDYKDGRGVAVHSAYTRWSGNTAAGWTPDNNTLLELSLARSDGQAAYADRGMDGVGFARDNMNLKFDKRELNSLVRRVEAQWYYNYIDHTMDNFSLRTPGSSYSISNPDRITAGGRFAATFALGARTSVVLGGDMQRNAHRFRGASGKSSPDIASLAALNSPRLEDMRFRQMGLFAEATRILGARSRLIGGFRADRHRAVDSRMCVGATMCPGTSPFKNNTLGSEDRRSLKSGFGRFEHDFMRGGAGTFYAGVGHSERFPDYWERLRQDPVTLKSAFLSTRPEKATQLDLGMLWKSGALTGSVSGFYGKVNDYILIRWAPTPSVTRNVDATTMGGEANAAYRFRLGLTADATLAYVRSNNDTDHKPLAQQPPLETRIGLNYDNRRFSLGALARLVGAQDRIDIGSGNIVSNGMDLGRTGGFSVFSLNGGYRFRRALLVTGGVDNLLNRTYAEHISRSGAMIPGFVQLSRINELGRTFWLKANFSID